MQFLYWLDANKETVGQACALVLFYQLKNEMRAGFKNLAERIDRQDARIEQLEKK